VRIVCLSDTHGKHGALTVPDGDVLVHAGDATMRGDEREIAAFANWLAGLPHRHKLVIAGNHDWLFERQPGLARELLGPVTYLLDSGLEIDGVRFWGSPWQPWFMDWAFNLRRGAPLRAKWELIPEGTDVLLTHGPPQGILDQVVGVVSRAMGAMLGQGEHVGCEELLAAVQRLRPRVHVFGHIHEGYGQETRDGTRFVNASNCDRLYRPVNPPIVVDL
jgi:predicted phosphodiesterase